MKAILDPSMENRIRDSFVCVETEIEFLRRDNIEEPLWIRGEHLCYWVSSLYRARGLKEGIDYQVLASPRKRLRIIAGNSVDELSHEIVEQAVEHLDRSPKLKLNELLASLTGDDFWTQPPSTEHAAKWLLAKFAAELRPLVEYQCRYWARKSSSEELRQIYEAPASGREKLLKMWLCVNDTSSRLGVFPIQVEGEAAKLLEEEWGRLLRETCGAVVERLSPKNPNAEHIAKAAYEYFALHVEFLTPSIIARIGSLLESPKRARLEEWMPRPCPHPLSLNSSVEQVFTWAIKEYFPYRRWQILAALDDEHVIEKLGNSFADWVLHNYPRLTAYSREESLLNVRGRYIVDKLINERPAFWVVVDGLNHVNHQRLLRHLAQTEASFGIEQDMALLAVLPTVTRQAKYGLTTGLFPRENAKNEWNMQKVFSAIFPNGIYAGKTQIDRLRAGLSDTNFCLCYWNMTAVDECYHEQTDSQAISHNVEAQLKALAENISNLVMNSPNRDRLAVVISTDHGQMMGPCVKSNSEGENIEVHGRTAYGKLLTDDTDANEAFVKSPDGSLVELNPTRFQLDRVITLALGRFYFGGWSTDSQRRAWGVHGGLYPEEVIVGFSVLSRKPYRKPITASIGGAGEVGKPGIIILKIDNPNPAPVFVLTLVAIEIEELTKGKSVLERVRPMDVGIIEINLHSFPNPTDGDLLPVNARLFYEYEDGVEHECEIHSVLTCKKMYSDQRPSLRDRFKK